MGENCNPYECPLCQKLEHQLEEFKRANSETHEKMWNAINDLKTNDAVQDSRYDTIIGQLNSVVAEIKTLQSVPGDNWKAFTKTMLSSVVTLLIGFMFGKLGII